LVTGMRASPPASVACTRAGRGQRAAGWRCFFDREGRLISVVILDVADGQIPGRELESSTDKLQHLGPVADLRALLRQQI